MTTVRQLVACEPELWRKATRHPFLDGARTGTLRGVAFDRWLEQDRMFVETLARAWGAMLGAAPTADLALVADGIAAFVAEMAWFDELCADRALTVPAVPLTVTAAYQAHLLRVARQPYPVAVSAMWTVEATYLEAWRSAVPGAPGYRRFVEHWTSPAFATFVDRLEESADRALAHAPAPVVDAAAEAVFVTAGHEAAFWAMTWGDDRAPE